MSTTILRDCAENIPHFVADSSVSPQGLKWAVDPVADVITTAGDLIYGTAADTVARLGIGTAGQVLKVNSGATAPEWGAAAGASFVGVSLKKSADQSITLNTATTVSFNQENYDTDGFHDNVTNNSRITIPSGKGGYYAINATVDWQQSANATNRQIRLLKNGTLINLVIQQDPGNNVDAWTIQCNTVLSLAATDYLEMQVFTGTTLNVQAAYTTAILTFFNATYLGA